MAGSEMSDKILSGSDAEKKATRVALVVFDIDGTLTDGGIYMGAEGESFKRFHCRDGLGIAAAVRQGLPVVLMTGRSGPIISRRAAELGIADSVMTGVAAKGRALQDLADRQGLSLGCIAFMGDDLNDLPALLRAGFSGAPADAAAEVKEQVDYVAAHQGGKGAARDFLEFILKAKGLWDQVVLSYSEDRGGNRQ